MLLSRVRARVSGQEGERLFRILGYGTILLLLGFLLFAFFLEPPTWSEAAGDLLAEIVFVILLISLVALSGDFLVVAFLAAPAVDRSLPGQQHTEEGPRSLRSDGTHSFFGLLFIVFD
jgi:hypothetical protein